MTMAKWVEKRTYCMVGLFYALALVVQGCAPAAASSGSAAVPRPERTAEGGVGAAPQHTCSPVDIEFQKVAPHPPGLVLTSARGLTLRSVDGLRVAHPERFDFRRFDPSNMAGVLSDGCAVEFWWARNPGPYEVNRIRILGAAASLSGSYAYLGLPSGTEPRWTPNFEGYRHVSSGQLSPSPAFYIGLWNRADGAPGSLVAAYGLEGEPVISLGAAPWTYDAIYSQGLPFHEGLYGFTLVDEPGASEPLYFVTYDWTYAGPTASSRRRSM